jgi:hypothetical protein
MQLNDNTKKDNLNQEDVNYVINKLKGYQDLHTTKLVEILKAYLKHKDFDKLHEDIFSLEALCLNEIPFHEIWDLDARMGYLDVIYPA